VIAIGFAVPTALRLAFLSQGYTAFRIFIFRTAVNSAAVFFPSITLFSIFLHVFHQRRSKRSL